MSGPVYTGQCNCGAVSASIAAAPLQVRQCWCRQCQATAAGGATHNAIFPADAVSLSGETTSWGYLAPSGNTLTQHFCPTCGTPVFAQSSARMQLMTFRLGFLDQPHDLAPQMAIWLDEKPDWAAVDPEIAHWPAQPPAAPAIK